MPVRSNRHPTSYVRDDRVCRDFEAYSVLREKPPAVTGKGIACRDWSGGGCRRIDGFSSG